MICRVYRAAKAISKAPGYGIFERIGFPLIGTFDSSRSPRRGKRPAGRSTLAEVVLTAITAARQRPVIGSRMTRQGHARFWEHLEVKFLRATRQ